MANLARLTPGGHEQAPTMLLMTGLYPLSGFQPFRTRLHDRVISTFGLQAIPYPWL